MEDLYTSLAWLPHAPADFRERCRDAARSGDPIGEVIARLSLFSLNENQLISLSRVIAQAQRHGLSLAPLLPFTLGIIGNATLEPLMPAFVASAARHGIALTCLAADFGQTVQQALSADSPINRAKPDAVLIALDFRGLSLPAGPDATDTASESVAESIAFVQSLRDGFRVNGDAPSILQTIAPPPETLFGSLDRSVPGTLRASCLAFNAALVQSLYGTQDVLFDVAALAETVGLGRWYSPIQWNIAKMAFDGRILPLYADHIGRLLGAMRGKAKKCLILDLDNTLWGGVIGDDGLEGIVLGSGDATGEAYIDVQRAALALHNRGVVLAVSSKNSDNVARAVFSQHPDMLLREDHIAIFQANWDDKPTNIMAIATELSLGTDAVVFLDDNPVERELIRKSLPEVAVPELPDDPALYSRTLAAAGYFESIAFSNEDRYRGDMYRQNSRRVELRERVGDIDSYLRSLNMVIVFRHFEASGRSRIAQLINKSNQFNLTSRRYSASDVRALEGDSTCFTLQVRLLDIFGDNGVISIVVCRSRGVSTWEIDTWLMSCRVLGRRVEQMVLRELLLQARLYGVSQLVGLYIPSQKNDLVREHYAKLGFRKVSEDDTGLTIWDLDTNTDVEPESMLVDRSGLKQSQLAHNVAANDVVPVSLETWG